MSIRNHVSLNTFIFKKKYWTFCDIFTLTDKILFLTQTSLLQSSHFFHLLAHLHSLQDFFHFHLSFFLQRSFYPSLSVSFEITETCELQTNVWGEAIKKRIEKKTKRKDKNTFFYLSTYQIESDFFSPGQSAISKMQSTISSLYLLSVLERVISYFRNLQNFFFLPILNWLWANVMCMCK